MGVRERNNQERRERLLAVARELFDAQGFEVTTVEEIASGAEVAIRTVYNFFPVKVDVLAAVLTEDIRGRLRDNQPSNGTLPADPHAGVLALVEATIAVFEDVDKAQQKLVFGRAILSGGGSEAGRFSLELDDFIRTSLRDRMAECVTAGTLPGTFAPDVAAGLIFAMLSGLYVDWLQSDAPFGEVVPTVAGYLDLILPHA